MESRDSTESGVRTDGQKERLCREQKGAFGHSRRRGRMLPHSRAGDRTAPWSPSAASRGVSLSRSAQISLARIWPPLP
jgi:hypothetical protein